MSAKTETDQLLSTIKLVMHLLGTSNRDIERSAGWHLYYLNRIFSGEIGLRFDHIVDIARALDMKVPELFLLAFPERDQSATFRRVRGTVQELSASPEPAPPPPPPPTREEIELLIDKALRRHLREQKKRA